MKKPFIWRKAIFSLILVFVLIYSIAIPTFAIGETIWGNVSFHCGYDSGGPSQDKGLEGTVGWVNMYGNYIAWKANTNKHQPEYWVQLKKITDVVWELQTDAFECPNCHQTYWISYSNMDSVYDGMNIQLCHAAPTPTPGEGQIMFSATKELSGGVNYFDFRDDEFTFDLVLTVNGNNYPISPSDRKTTPGGTTTWGPFTFTEGTVVTYAITETNISTGFTFLNKVIRIGSTVVTEGDPVTITNNGNIMVTYTFTNEPPEPPPDPGTLKITKIFEGLDTLGDVPADWNATFTVTGPDDFGDNGKYVIEYKDFNNYNTHNFGSVPFGTYRVEEDDAGVITGYTWKEYTVSADGAQVSSIQIGSGDNFELTVTNKYEKNGSIRVTKLFGSANSEATWVVPDGFEATIRVVGPEGPDAKTYVKTIDRTNPVAVFPDLVPGKYIVTEEPGNSDYGYKFSPYISDDGEVTVTVGETKDVIITNWYDYYSLVIMKKYSGASLPLNFYVKVTGGNGYDSGPLYIEDADWVDQDSGDIHWYLSDLRAGEYNVEEFNYTVSGLVRESSPTSYTVTVPNLDREQGSDFDANVTLVNNYAPPPPVVNTPEFYIVKTTNGYTGTFSFIYDYVWDEEYTGREVSNGSETVTFSGPDRFKVVLPEDFTGVVKVKEVTDTPSANWAYDTSEYTLIFLNGEFKEGFRTRGENTEPVNLVEFNDQEVIEAGFYNSYTPPPPPPPGLGNLTITKVVSGTAIPEGYDATFTVTGPNGYSRTLTYAGNFSNGSFTITGLNPGNYTVTETTAPTIDGYSWTVSGSGNVTAVVSGQTVSVTITNTYSAPPTVPPDDGLTITPPEIPTGETPTPPPVDEIEESTPIIDPDTPLGEIPQTGISSIYEYFTLFGIVMISLGVLALWIKKEEARRRAARNK